MDGWIDICYALGREEIRVNQSGISSEHTFISEFKILSQTHFFMFFEL